MKKIILTALLALIITACGVLKTTDGSEDLRVRPDPGAGQTPIQTATPSRIPTATVGWQLTAVAAEATAFEAQRLHIQATSDEKARIQEQLSWTAAADQATMQSAQTTAEAVAVTAAAWPTFYPGTATQQVEDRFAAQTQAADHRTQLAATQSAPTLVIAMANAEAQAKYADGNQKANLIVKYAAAFFIFLLSIALVTIILRRDNAPVEQTSILTDLNQTPLEQPVREPIPFVERNGRRIRAEIRCPDQILVDLAEGVIERKMTLAYNAWEGTSVHKYLKAIREDFAFFDFAKTIKNGNGQMDLMSEGEKFLLDVIDHRGPPPPFKCVTDSA